FESFLASSAASPWARAGATAEKHASRAAATAILSTPLWLESFFVILTVLSLIGRGPDPLSPNTGAVGVPLQSVCRRGDAQSPLDAERFSFHPLQEAVELCVELLAALPEHQVLAHRDELDGRSIGSRPSGDDRLPLVPHHEEQRELAVERLQILLVIDVSAGL